MERDAIEGRRVLLSYSRRNQYIARQIAADLRRMGLVPWLDERDIEINTRWLDEIEKNIQSSDAFLLLWSPEAQASDYVEHEVVLARKCLAPEAFSIVRVAGAETDMPESIRRVQHIAMVRDYFGGLQRLAQRLGATAPATTLDTFESAARFSDAHSQLQNDSGRSWPLRWPDASGGTKSVTFVSVPWLPSGYAMSWRVGESESDLTPGSDLFVVLKFTAEARRDTLMETLKYIRDEIDTEFSQYRERYPQLLLIEGPQREGKYLIPNDQPHQWSDAIDLCEHAITQLGGRLRLHFIMDAPQALTFPLATRLKTLGAFDVYNLDRTASGTPVYLRVHSEG